jgi:ribosomal protein S18 acetylase RimI-like enzyme
VAGVAPGDAELAMVVRDDYQAQGVGTALVERTLDGARSSGITTLRCYVLPENRAALRLLQRLDAPRRSRFHQGLVEVTLKLTE